MLSRASDERDVRLENDERAGEPLMELWLRLREEREEEGKIEAAEREMAMSLKDKSSEDREVRRDKVCGNPAWSIWRDLFEREMDVRRPCESQLTPIHDELQGSPDMLVVSQVSSACVGSDVMDLLKSPRARRVLESAPNSSKCLRSTSTWRLPIGFPAETDKNISCISTGNHLPVATPLAMGSKLITVSGSIHHDQS